MTGTELKCTVTLPVTSLSKMMFKLYPLEIVRITSWMSASLTSSGDMTCCSGSTGFCSVTLAASGGVAGFSPKDVTAKQNVMHVIIMPVLMTVRFIGTLLFADFLHLDYVFHHDHAQKFLGGGYAPLNLVDAVLYQRLHPDRPKVKADLVLGGILRYQVPQGVIDKHHLEYTDPAFVSKTMAFRTSHGLIGIGKRHVR